MSRPPRHILETYDRAQLIAVIEAEREEHEEAVKQSRYDVLDLKAKLNRIVKYVGAYDVINTHTLGQFLGLKLTSGQARLTQAEVQGIASGVRDSMFEHHMPGYEPFNEYVNQTQNPRAYQQRHDHAHPEGSETQSFEKLSQRSCQLDRDLDRAPSLATRAAGSMSRLFNDAEDLDRVRKDTTYLTRPIIQRTLGSASGGNMATIPFPPRGGSHTGSRLAGSSHVAGPTRSGIGRSTPSVSSPLSSSSSIYTPNRFDVFGEGGDSSQSRSRRGSLSDSMLSLPVPLSPLKNSSTSPWSFSGRMVGDMPELPGLQATPVRSRAGSLSGSGPLPPLYVSSGHRTTSTFSADLDSFPSLPDPAPARRRTSSANRSSSNSASNLPEQHSRASGSSTNNGQYQFSKRDKGKRPAADGRR